LGTSVDYPFFLNCIHPQDRDAVDQAWRQALLGARYDIRHRIISAGEVRWVREQAEMVCDACGVVVQVVGTVQDISDWHASQQELLSSRQALRDLAAHNDKLREEERTRIAREIHDHLGQHLTALRMETVLLGAHCCQAHPEMMERVQRMTETIDETIEVVRDVSTALRPACLDLGLVAAADWALAVFQRRTGIQGTLICGHESIDLDDQRATAIFRILQEALNNVARHARATHVQVTLSLQAMDLLLETSDNGIGFDPLSTPLKKTFGIIGMRERALEFGGALTITRRALGGTTLQVLVPLEQGAAA
jgi:signal transduction histidine kinase